MAAVLIGVCSLFVAIYDSALTRQGQRISVWPHVEIWPSISASGLSLMVINSGVGPARIEAAAVTASGERKRDWADALGAVIGEPYEQDLWFSLVNGRVLRPGEEYAILRTVEGTQAPRVASAVRDQMRESVLDVHICYCSVYNECWVTTMQEVIGRLEGVTIAHDSRRVRSCARQLVSGI